MAPKNAMASERDAVLALLQRLAAAAPPMGVDLATEFEGVELEDLRSLVAFASQA